MAHRHNGRANAGKAPAALAHGIVITGDLRVQLLGLNLLPVKVRLLISSTELAQSLGLGWWKGAARSLKADRDPKRDRHQGDPQRAPARVGARHRGSPRSGSDDNGGGGGGAAARATRRRRSR